jgi:hypothetical protein
MIAVGIGFSAGIMILISALELSSRSKRGRWRNEHHLGGERWGGECLARQFGDTAYASCA